MQLYINFKTSHVKVYLIGIPFILRLLLHFKTSHVKVYLLQISLNSYQK